MFQHFSIQNSLSYC